VEVLDKLTRQGVAVATDVELVSAAVPFARLDMAESVVVLETAVLAIAELAAVAIHANPVALQYLAAVQLALALLGTVLNAASSDSTPMAVFVGSDSKTHLSTQPALPTQRSMVEPMTSTIETA